MIKKRAMILVSNDPESIRLGANEIVQHLNESLATYGLQDEVDVSTVSDINHSNILPLVVVYPEAVVYGPVKASDVRYLVEEHLYKGRVVDDLLAPPKMLTGQIGWLRGHKGYNPAEQRIVLERAGRIDPDNIEEYITSNGYDALGKVLSEMTPESVIDVVEKSGLQGRGGAGFPTGRKWKFVRAAQGSKKYIVCNADESEPGTFKDRIVLEGDPHVIIESMAIAAYAIGADEGYIYIRGEYGLAYRRLEKAILQAREFGFLGNNIFGTEFNFDIHIHAGAGAYVCGEETALLESLEGKRGEPRSRPPYPVTKGLWNKPTSVNNVETLANIPAIIRNGAEWYRSIGTPSSPGTKVYTIMGNVNFSGVIEVPMGVTLREVINIYAKGMKPGSTFKLAQTGGSSGSIIPAVLQDTPMDFESFRKAGVSLGSGALLICDQNTCIVDLVKVLLQFFRFESCGKCTPCRVGTQRTYEIVERISKGQGKLEELDTLLDLANEMERASNCGLGQTATVPIRDMLKHFRTEVEAHIRSGSCPTGVCEMAQEVEKV
ncbi:MAG: NADH-quinone oxidoreductase subunit NuoF [Anaerolineales bacterium]|nr:NADH-quinone oxidoreductase subunit NuoF [Anaerolineales bacterium]MBL0344930.1 NADH-quinone oxidoreductase subunit NuoF [Anaerolineales bacterium]